MQKITDHKESANDKGGLFANHSRNELIPIIQKQGEQLVDARQLHEFLKVKSGFNDWFRNRVNDFEFKQGVDFIASKILVAKTHKFEYQLTLDMAKELAMIERNPQGRQIRQYFIACEKKLRIVSKVDVPGVAFKLLQIDKATKPIKLNGRKLYDYRKVQQMLGFSIKGSLNNVRRCFDSQLVLFDQKSYVSEEYVELMISRANTRHVEVYTRSVQPVLPMGFGYSSLNV